MTFSASWESDSTKTFTEFQRFAASTSSSSKYRVVRNTLPSSPTQKAMSTAWEATLMGNLVLENTLSDNLMCLASLKGFKALPRCLAERHIPSQLVTEERFTLGGKASMEVWDLETQDHKIDLN